MTLSLRHTYIPKTVVDFAGTSSFGGRDDELVLCAGKGEPYSGRSFTPWRTEGNCKPVIFTYGTANPHPTYTTSARQLWGAT